MSDGSVERPETVGIDEIAGDWTMGRRGFLGAAAFAALGLVGRKARADEKGAAAPKRACHEGVTAYHGYLRAISVGPDGKRCAMTSSSSDGYMTRLWELPGGRLLGRFKGEGKAVLSPDGSLLACPASDGSIRLVRAADGIETAVLKGHTQPIVNLAISPDGTILASASSQETTVRLWALPGGKPLGVLSGHTNKVYWIAFTPDGKRLLSSGLDYTIRVWDMPGGGSARTITIPASTGVNFYSGFVAAPDGEHLMLLLGGGKRMIWKLSNGMETDRVLPVPKFYADRCRQADRGNEVVFDPAGKMVLLYNGARAGGEAVIREYPGGGVLAIFSCENKNTDTIRMVFHPDGRYIVTARGGYSGELALWEMLPPAGLVSRGDMGRLPKLGAVSGYGDNFAVSPDGAFVIAGQDGRLAVFTLPDMEFVECFFDHEELPDYRRVRVAECKNAKGETMYRVLPEKEPLPAGSVCACDTVTGMRKVSGGGSGSGAFCTCKGVHLRAGQMMTLNPIS